MGNNEHLHGAPPPQRQQATSLSAVRAVAVVSALQARHGKAPGEHVVDLWHAAAELARRFDQTDAGGDVGAEPEQAAWQIIRIVQMASIDAAAVRGLAAQGGPPC